MISAAGYFQNCKSNSAEKINPLLATPELTIHTYWHYLNLRDYRSALACFVDFKNDYYDSSSVHPLPDVDSLKVDSIISEKSTGKNLREIRYRVKFYSRKDSISKQYIAADRLVLTDEGWKIKDVIIPE